MNSYAVHIAIAALAGASLAAISSYFLHSNAIDELLDFALAIECARGGVQTTGATKKAGDGGGFSPMKRMNTRPRRGMLRRASRWRSERKNLLDVANSMEEAVDEKARDEAGEERVLFGIECLQGGTFESGQVLSDFYSD